MIAEKIKILREQNKWTQTQLSKKLGITRSAVNGWEMGISIPSTQYIVELAQIFKVSTDFLLGVNTTCSINVAGLTDEDIAAVNNLVKHLRSKN